ncbi:MAG TPA: multicopper oxidase domain-containing protein [Clostridia bacterium]|nr:multicopper oxidase domain-containing protein [Clostridia bacterium]
MSTRRHFLKVSALTGAGALLAPRIPVPQLFAARRTSPTLARFVDVLPRPAVMTPVTGTAGGAATYRVSMSEFAQQLHRDLPPTRVWGYAGQYPGPTIEVHRGLPIAVQWQKNLPSAHLLPIDHTIHGAGYDQPDVRAVVHLHGGKVMPEDDGYPLAWSTSAGEHGPNYYSDTFLYPNDQPATTLWYHDHALGITRLNVHAGLAGFFLVRDSVEDALNLPRGQYEIPLVIQDRNFNADGSLFYSGEGLTSAHPVWIPEFFGDTALVNGKVWPYLEVEPRRYRFRMLNGSNARFYHLALDKGLPFWQIGTDGGLLPRAVAMPRLLMGPAERCDVIVDFSGLAPGTSINLANNARSPFPDGTDTRLPQIMQFRVTSLSSPDATTPPQNLLLPNVPLLDPTGANVRDVVISEIIDEEADAPLEGLLDVKYFDMEPDKLPALGSTEVWRIINTTGDAHPIHLHLVQFQILDRRTFDEETYDETGKIVYTGPAKAPAPNERSAWKDTVLSYPGTVTRIIAKFELPAGAVTQPGQRLRYLIHCHILEHEDNEMMRPYEVVC